MITTSHTITPSPPPFHPILSPLQSYTTLVDRYVLLTELNQNPHSTMSHIGTNVKTTSEPPKLREIKFLGGAKAVVQVDKDTASTTNTSEKRPLVQSNKKIPEHLFPSSSSFSAAVANGTMRVREIHDHSGKLAVVMALFGLVEIEEYRGERENSPRRDADPFILHVVSLLMRAVVICESIRAAEAKEEKETEILVIGRSHNLQYTRSTPPSHPPSQPSISSAFCSLLTPGNSPATTWLGHCLLKIGDALDRLDRRADALSAHESALQFRCDQLAQREDDDELFVLTSELHDTMAGVAESSERVGQLLIEVGRG